MGRFLEEASAALADEPARLLHALEHPDPRPGELALDALCDPMYARALHALLRDTISPDVVHGGLKYNVIPGEAEVIVDCRTLPGTTEARMRSEIERRLGPDLRPHCTIERIIDAPPVEAPTDSDLYRLLTDVLRAHAPGAVPVPVTMPFATDAKHLARLGVPSYGFSPLRLAPEERFLERFHGIDERVGVDALRWGLPVLYDVVREFCG